MATGLCADRFSGVLGGGRGAYVTLPGDAALDADDPGRAGRAFAERLAGAARHGAYEAALAELRAVRGSLDAPLAAELLDSVAATVASHTVRAWAVAAFDGLHCSALTDRHHRVLRHQFQVVSDRSAVVFDLHLWAEGVTEGHPRDSPGARTACGLALDRGSEDYLSVQFAHLEAWNTLKQARRCPGCEPHAASFYETTPLGPDTPLFAPEEQARFVADVRDRIREALRTAVTRGRAVLTAERVQKLADGAYKQALLQAAVRHAYDDADDARFERITATMRLGSVFISAKFSCNWKPTPKELLTRADWEWALKRRMPKRPYTVDSVEHQTAGHYRGQQLFAESLLEAAYANIDERRYGQRTSRRGPPSRRAAN